MQRQRGVPTFFDNESSEHGSLELPYPTPEVSTRDCTVYVFAERAHSALWSVLVARRARLCECFRDGRLCAPLDKKLSTLVDAYAIDLFTLLGDYGGAGTHRLLLGAANNAEEPPVYAWRSSCDGLDYVSASLHFECYMAQLLAYVVHFNRLASWRLERLQRWQSLVQPSETLASCERNLDAWMRGGGDQQRDASIQFMLSASARRCCASLEAWQSLRAYNALRYPIEVSREFTQLLSALDLVWQDVDAHEAAEAGLLIYDDANHAHWMRPPQQAVTTTTTPLTSTQLVKLTVRLGALVRAFTFLAHRRWHEHARTLARLVQSCERAALYARTHELVDEAAYEEAYACVLALLLRSGDDDDVVIVDTIEELRSQVLEAAASTTQLRSTRPTEELQCLEAAERATLSLYL